MSTPPVRTPDFVVRRAGQWFLTPVGDDVPIEIDVAELRQRIAESSFRPPISPLQLAEVPPLVDSSWFVPVHTIVAGVSPDGLVVESVAGGHLALDDDDLTLLDAMGPGKSITDLREATDVTDVAERVARLVGMGSLTYLPPDDDEPEPEPVAEPVDVMPMEASLIDQDDRRTGWRDRVRRAVTGRHDLVTTTSPEDPTEPRPDTRPETLSEARADPAPGDTDDDVPSWERVVAHPGGPEGRVPVYAMWSTRTGPMLAVGMLTAAARAHDAGRLNEIYEIRRPESAEAILEDLAGRTGPAVLLCSDYVFTVELNLEVARKARAMNPEVLVVHGGPSSPKHEQDATRFLNDNPDAAHILTRGEGEHMICELLTALAPTLPAFDPDALRSIEGLTFRHPATGELIRTADRTRSADLEEFPSPYLTGEFDHIEGTAWIHCLSIETNRGCPYGCTFCDWGSATLSRIRKFEIDRVVAEVAWAAVRRVEAVNLVDANFGIMSRDVEITRRVGEVKQASGFPTFLVFAPAKNTTKHLTKIFDVLSEHSIHPAASISLQTIDPDTLAALDRSNIATDHFVALAADIRRRGHAVIGDILLGIPNQTYDIYKADLQFMSDHELHVRTHPLQHLPNAPMNEPEYIEKYQIEVEDGRVVATSTFDREDRRRMFRLRKIDLVFERYAILRHITKWAQWDHDVRSHDILDRVIDVTERSPERYPCLTWLVDYFDLYPVAPIGWDSVYAEVRMLLTEEFDLPVTSASECAFTVQRWLMPEPGRTFPTTIRLAHDFVAYYLDATRSLYSTGHAGRPPQPLEAYPPADFTIEGDPLNVCDWGMHFGGETRSEKFQGDFENGACAANELLSPLIRNLPWVEANGLTPPIPVVLDADVVTSGFDLEVDLDSTDLIEPTPVELTSRR